MIRRSSPKSGAWKSVAICTLLALPLAGMAAYGDGGTRTEAPSDLAPAPARSTSAERADGLTVSVFASQTDSGKVVLESGSDRLFDPGAIGDVVVGAQVLTILKPEFRFRTVYWAGGRVRQGTLWGDLIVQGFGDPTVDDVRLKWVTHQLALGGVQRIVGSIRLDDGYFRTGGEVGDPESADEDEDDATDDDAGENDEAADGGTHAGAEGSKGPAAKGVLAVAEGKPVAPLIWELAPDEGLGALSYNGNRARLQIRPTRVGMRAEVLVDPDIGHINLYPYVETMPYARRVRHVVTSTATGTSVLLTGAVAPGEPARQIEIEVGSRSLYFGHALHRHLRREGIRVRRRVTTQPQEGRRRWLISDFSPPLVEILADVFHGDLRTRGRATMEALVRTIAVGSSGDNGSIDVGLARLRDSLIDEVGLTRNAFRLPSPLGRPGELSTRQIVQVLAAIDQRYMLSSDLNRAIGPAATQRLLVGRLDPRQMRAVRAVVDAVAGQLTMAGYAKSPQGPIAFAIVIKGAQPVEALWETALESLNEIAPPDPSGPQLSRTPP